jgi:hypothetical protein
MRLVGTIVLSSLLASSQYGWAAPLTAALHGSLSGSVQNSSGSAVAPTGAVHATIRANNNNGVITASLEGTAANTGALGLAIAFSAQYDAATQAFIGLYSDTPGQTPDTPLRFNNVSGLSWQAAISGTAPSSTGERAYSLNVNLALEPSAIFPLARLPTANVFSGRLNSQQSLQVPVNLPALQASEIMTLDMKFEGNWSASTFLDSTGTARLTGKTSGTFSTVRGSTLRVVPVGNNSVTVPVAINGSFSGSLFSVSATELAFKGAWVSQRNGQTLGGDISISVPLQNLSRFPFNMTGTAQISTGVPELPTLSLPFSANGEFPLSLNGIGSGGSGGATPGTEPKEPVVSSAVKIKHLGVNLAPYDITTNRAGDFMFTRENMTFNLLFFNFGYVIPANSVGPEKGNPQPTFILPLGTKVRALIDGQVVRVSKLYSNDYSVMLQGQGSDLIFELEHVINVVVKEGDRVLAGDVVAEVSDYAAHNYAGMGLVEIGVLRGGTTPTHLCPFDYLDESIREATLNNITALQQAWEVYRGDSGLYYEAGEVVTGCYRRTPIDG